MCVYTKALLLLFCIGAFTLTYVAALPIDTIGSMPTDLAVVLQRPRRQFDFNLSAEHDDKEDETEIALEAIANLWRSSDGNTQVEGSAKVLHRSNGLESGNTQYSARLHVHHDYKKK